ncbi:LysE family translocator (plasmid) [Novosphingobium resinovorum]|uniref:LysE family translocator n=1 Tax=Sphingomonadaceae TaxID=41297 RepID=UPI00027CBC2A|nr:MULTISPECIES: LysE family translocator [Sphingomonadaceae]EJU13150.1 amino acid efflux protein [Sphingomonas sp. LH128]WJM29883.1 LysE family translocator [Novosphingobium resinovorum]
MIASLITYSAALGIAAAIPGPGVAAVVGQSMGNGLKAALFLLGGIILGDLTYLTVAVAGLAGIAKAFSGAFLVIKVLGGCYLAYIAWKMWTSTGGIVQARAKESPSGLGSFLSGYSLTLGNPKTIVFYLALLPTVLDLGAVGRTGAMGCAGMRHGIDAGGHAGALRNPGASRPQRDRPAIGAATHHACRSRHHRINRRDRLGPGRTGTLAPHLTRDQEVISN